MASQMFSYGKGSIGLGQIVLASDDIRAVLLDSGYTFDDTDQYLSDVSASAQIARSGALANQTLSATGVFDADDAVVSAVGGSDNVVALILYKYNASDNAARLISYHEGLSVTPNGQDLIIKWSSGANKIFKL